MTSMELDARRMDIFREIMQINDMEVLDGLKRSLKRLKSKAAKAASMPVQEDLTPYTIEEINARIDEAEADIDAGRVYTSEQMHKMMEAIYPWLCK